MELYVYVPTRGRINTQKSMEFLRLEKIHTEGIAKVEFVVPRCEALKFSESHSWARVSIVEDNWKIGTISDHILRTRRGRYKVLIDDDFQLLRRRDRNNPSQKGGVATDKDAFDLFERIRYWLDQGYVHGGISLRQTNHFCKDGWFKTNSRVSGFMFFDTKIVNQEDVRFNEVEERQDFHMTLSLLELGYLNVVDYEFTVGQYLTGTNAPGGCSSYRSPEFLLEQAELLCKLHPNVKLVYKDRTSEDAKKMGGDLGIPDVNIQWVKSLGIRKKERKAELDGGNYVLAD